MKCILKNISTWCIVWFKKNWPEDTTQVRLTIGLNLVLYYIYCSHFFIRFKYIYLYFKHSYGKIAVTLNFHHSVLYRHIHNTYLNSVLYKNKPSVLNIYIYTIIICIRRRSGPCQFTTSTWGMKVYQSRLGHGHFPPTHRIRIKSNNTIYATHFNVFVIPVLSLFKSNPTAIFY